MELGSQIRKHRTEQELSQEALAEKLCVSRQTISNWENGKSYPDMKSLLLLSEVFHTSIDGLIKGDVEKMKQEIDEQEFAAFQKNSYIFSILFAALLVLPVPLVIFLKWTGIFIYILLYAIAMYDAIKIETYKNKYDIQTYREILAFTEGKSLSEIEKAREEGKRPYQKGLLAAGSGVLVVVIAVITAEILRCFS